MWPRCVFVEVLPPRCASDRIGYCGHASTVTGDRCSRMAPHLADANFALKNELRLHVDDQSYIFRTLINIISTVWSVYLYLIESDWDDFT